MPDAASIRRIALLALLLLGVRLASAVVVSGPGYTDAYYFADVAGRVARGEGLTADFVWSPVEAGHLVLPVPSHLFWVPLPTVLGAIGIAIGGSLLGDFRAAQAVLVLVAALVPVVAYVAARTLGAGDLPALAAASAAGLGGLFAPGFVAIDAYAPAAVLGTLFFLAYAGAARGDVRWGLTAGLLVGLLYLTRSEGALFGLALLALTLARRSRWAGMTGAFVAVTIGGAWLVRDAAAGAPPDLLARTALLTRYDQFFAVASPTWDAFVASLGTVVAAKGAALLGNAGTFLFTFALVLVPALVAGARALRSRPEVRAWVALLVLVYLAQSLVWTLHSTRGSYFHSLAAFFPFGVAVAAVGAERLLVSRPSSVRAGWTAGALVLVAAISLTAVVQWGAVFNAAARARADAVSAIPDGPFLAIDGAAWRWLSGRPAIVTPADGLEEAACFVARFGARSIVLEEAHFAAYDALYSGAARPAWLSAPIERGPIRIFPVAPGHDLGCADAR